MAFSWTSIRRAEQAGAGRRSRHPVFDELNLTDHTRDMLRRGTFVAITVNSIIGVETDAPVEQGNDGVAEYSSGHIEPVQSELVVKSSHSTEGNPHTIAEVRRILRLHMEPKAGTAAREPR